MPVQVNPLILQHLFYEMMNDLEDAQESLYGDDLSRMMNTQCKKKRSEYRKKLQELMKQD